MTALAKIENINNSQEMAMIDQVVIQGDLSKLNPEQRVTYYNNVCKSLGLNPFTRPFDYISLNGKLTLYAKKDATEQLRKLNGISIEKLESKLVDDLYIVTATARTKDGRTDSSTGAVTIGSLKGDAKANALMKAETKAKRRVTLSISGMGWCDETEIDSIQSARLVDVDVTTGEMGSGKLSQTQVIELVTILNSCSIDYQKQVYDFIPKKYKVDIVDEVPAREYELLKKAFSAKKSEHQKFLAEKEMTLNVEEIKE
jgi:hypothetical protein